MIEVKRNSKAKLLQVYFSKLSKIVSSKRVLASSVLSDFAKLSAETYFLLFSLKTIRYTARRNALRGNRQTKQGARKLDGSLSFR